MKINVKPIGSFCFFKSKLLSLFCFVSITLYATGPGKIEGSVSDAEDFKPIPSANVELLKRSDSSVIKIVQTNTEGNYMITDVTFGTYLLRVSSMAYKKYYIPEFEITPQKTSVKFGTTYLISEVKSLNEVTVIGNKLTGMIEDEKTIYTIKGKSAEIAQSGLELLRQIPEVTVDYMSNDVKLAGSNNILFQVNGKKVDRNYLEQLNPSLIDKIEVSTNPGVKYDSEVDAVINIVLKKNMLYGLSTRIRLDVPTGNTVLSSNRISFDIFRKNIRFYIAANARIQNFDVFANTQRLNTLESGESTILNQSGTGNSFNKRGGFSYGIDWFSNDKNTFNFYSSIQPRIPNNDDFSSDIVTSIDQNSKHMMGNYKTGRKNLFYDYSLFYKHQFSKKFHEITFESYWSNRKNQSSNSSYQLVYMDNEILGTDPINGINLITDDNNSQFNLKTDYTYPFTEKFKLSVGYNGNFTRSNTTKYETFESLYDRIDYDEDRHSGYANISLTKGNLNLQTGMRLEYSDIHILHGYDTINNYNSLLPFVSGQYKLGKKHTFRINYRRSIQRPGVNQLSPMSFKSDPYSQSAGNPGLKPAYFDRFEFMHRIQIIGPVYVSYRPYVSFINKAIREVNIDSSDLVLRSKYSNVSNELEYGITLSGTLAFVKWWTISPTYTYYNRVLKALPEYGILSEQHRTSWNIGIQSNMNLPKEWVVFIEYNYGSPVISQQSTSQRNYEFVTGFYKKMNKNFNVTVFTLNPWANRYYSNKSKTSVNNLIQNSEQGINYSYVFVIRLGFNFNYGKEGKKLDRVIESDEESGGKKGIL